MTLGKDMRDQLDAFADFYASLGNVITYISDYIDYVATSSFILVFRITD